MTTAALQGADVQRVASEGDKENFKAAARMECGGKETAVVDVDARGAEPQLQQGSGLYQEPPVLAPSADDGQQLPGASVAAWAGVEAAPLAAAEAQPAAPPEVLLPAADASMPTAEVQIPIVEAPAPAEAETAAAEAVAAEAASAPLPTTSAAPSAIPLAAPSAGNASGVARSGTPVPTSSDPLAGDKTTSRGVNDSDYRFSEDEAASGGGGSDSDYVFSDEEEEMRKKRWLRPTPEGARRSKRFKGDAEGEDEGGQEEGEDRRPRRGQETSTAQASRAASEDVSEVVVSPIGQIIKREMSQEQIEAEVKQVQGMWEMASILDFLRRFRPQLKLSRDFGADELERVLVTSAGDGGLLADVHMDLMRGISPKSDISAANWAVHLANKIKYHWKGLLDGTLCPFRPEKYFEAATYATLPSVQRVRTLNFLCSIRADKEDIQERIMACENTRPPPKPAAAPLPKPKPPRPTRGQGSTPAPPDPEPDTYDSFRREPTGMDASGIAYYLFDMSDSIGFRLYREIPAALLRSISGAVSEADEAARSEAAAAAAAAAAAERAAEEERRAKKSGGRKRKEKRQHKALLELPDPPAEGKWELLASTLPEMQAVGERLARSLKPADKEMGTLILTKSLTLAADMQARQEAEERRVRAAARVQKKLGVDVVAEFGRARRERRNINYAFTDYDDVIRSAIKRSSRAESPPEEERRRRRGNSPPRPDPVAEAQRGLRRGRSAAAIHEEIPATDLNERQMRMLARSRSTSGMEELQAAQEAEAAAMRDDEDDEEYEDEEMEGEEQEQERQPQWQQQQGQRGAAAQPAYQPHQHQQQYANVAQLQQQAMAPQMGYTGAPGAGAQLQAQAQAQGAAGSQFYMAAQQAFDQGSLQCQGQAPLQYGQQHQQAVYGQQQPMYGQQGQGQGQFYQAAAGAAPFPGGAYMAGYPAAAGGFQMAAQPGAAQGMNAPAYQYPQQAYGALPQQQQGAAQQQQPQPQSGRRARKSSQYAAVQYQQYDELEEEEEEEESLGGGDDDEDEDFDPRYG